MIICSCWLADRQIDKSTICPKKNACVLHGCWHTQTCLFFCMLVAILGKAYNKCRKRLWTDWLTYGNRNTKPTKVKAASISNSSLQHLCMSDLYHGITPRMYPTAKDGYDQGIKSDLHQVSRSRYQHLKGGTWWNLFWSCILASMNTMVIHG